MNDDIDMKGFHTHSVWECCCLSDGEMKVLEKKIDLVLQRIKNKNATGFKKKEYPKNPVKASLFGPLPVPTCHGQSAHFGSTLGCPKLSDELGRGPIQLVEGLKENKFCRILNVGTRFFNDKSN